MTNENDIQPSALIDEVAERIVTVTLVSDYVETVIGSHRPELITAIASILADFKRAIELQEYGAANIARQSVSSSIATRASLIALRLEALPEQATLDEVVAAIADELSSWVVVEPEVAKLIEEARVFVTPSVLVLPISKTRSLVEGLCTALEQQITARHVLSRALQSAIRELPDELWCIITDYLTDDQKQASLARKVSL